MPLTINVGLSRKASKDYQSTGVSINVTAELDQALLARPVELQGQVDRLYEQAEAALQRQIEQMTAASPPGAVSAGDHGRRQTSSSRVEPGTITVSQKRAIGAIGDRLNLDPAHVASQMFGRQVAELSVREASQLIDELKRTPAASSNGRRGHGR
jgi:hypothetical protein